MPTSSDLAKILIVDDEKEICDLLARRFRIFGFPTHTATNGEQACQILAADNSVQIVVSDLKMPRMNGFELLRKARDLRGLQVKFFVITGQLHCSTEECLARGADGILHKPFDARSLLNIVRSATLSLTERLRFPPNQEPVAKIKAKIKSLAPPGELAFLGRGGLALVHDLSLDTESLVALDVRSQEVHLEGHGVIRWRRPHGKSQQHLLGIEFVHLSKKSLASVLAWLEANNPASYIPSPYIDSSIPSTAKLQSTG